MSSHHPRLVRLAFLVLLAVLAVVYFHDLGRADLWMDEIWWAFQVTEPELRDTVRLHAHARPPLLLTLLARGAMQVLPPTEAGFRTPPALLGLLAVALFWKWAGFLPPAARLSLTFLFGALPPLLTWTHLFKHYTADIAATLAAALACEAFLRAPPGAGRAYRLVGVLSVALGFSFPIFFWIPLTLALIVRGAIRHRGSAPTRADLRPALLLLAVALAYYRLWPNDGSTFLQFAPGSVPPANALDRLGWLLEQGGRVVATPLQPIPLAVQAVGLLAGGWCAFRERRLAGLWVFPVLVVVAGTGALGLFPLAGGRFTVFLYPLVFMTFGLGLHAVAERMTQEAARRLGRGARAWGASVFGATVFVLALPGLAAFFAGRDGRPREQIGEAIAVLEREYREGDGVFVNRLALAGWQWYAQDRSREVGRWRPSAAGFDVYVGSDERFRDATFEADLQQVFSAGKESVFVLFTHLEAAPGREADLAFIRRHLVGRGTLEELHARDGAWLWRVRPAASRPASPQPPPRAPGG